jgi:hypothetical protein
VRVKGVFLSFIEYTSDALMPHPLIIFMASLCQPKAYIKDDFMTIFETNRIESDEYGAIVKIDDA